MRGIRITIEVIVILMKNFPTDETDEEMTSPYPLLKGEGKTPAPNLS